MTAHHQADRAGYAGANFRTSPQIHREDINRARQAAEALFAPKRHVTESSAPDPVPSVDEAARRPRFLRALRVQSTRVDLAEAHVKHDRPTRWEEIPASHFARVRAWLKYGMTIPQVAEVYGVTPGDIERILQNA